MTSSWNKFMLLMWKNWLLQWRHPIQTLIEILAPVLFALLLVIIRSLVDPKLNDQPIMYPEFSPMPNINSRPIDDNSTFSRFRSLMNQTVTLAYSPKQPALEQLMNNISDYMNNDVAILNLRGCYNSSDLESVLMTDESIMAGIEFPDSLVEVQGLPQSLTYAIRFPAESRYEPFPRQELAPSNWRTNLLFPIYQIAGPRIKNSTDGGYPPGYRQEGFLGLQHLVSSAISLYHISKQFMFLSVMDLSQINLPKIQLQRYPYPGYLDDPLLPALQGFVSIIIMLSFVYTCISTVKVITTEKERQLKEAMKIMGLPNWLHWTAWFIKTLSFVLVSIILITILVKVKWYTDKDFSVFTNSSTVILFLVLLFYMFATITFCFMISVFFSKANTASTIAGLMWFLSYAPYLFLQQKYEDLSLSQKLFACLGSNSAMAYAFQLMLMHEGTGEGLQWRNIWKPITPDDNFVLGQVMIMLVVDAVIYLLITLYVEQVFPGDYGVPQPWYYLFTASYWCGTPQYQGVEDYEPVGNTNNEMYEKEPINLKAGVQIRHLRKVYGGSKGKVAVKDLTMNMYEGQITVLLGHNGAGKTTTMSMLTGMFPPTSGTAVIDGHDIRTDMTSVRASLGLCPQHNVLFDELTVREHLYFFGRLKGLSKVKVKKEADKYIELLELIPKADSKSCTLSGGMQRKLSVGVALCGGSRVVMFDEPTSGMDPAARRALWDLLQNEKKDRTILLTTHFMDEADLLGDRIAIMAGGTLHCCGSSFFLKKRYGAGYHLVMEKSANCDPKLVTNLLRNFIPNIDVDTDIGSELSYVLAENQALVFERMLGALERASDELGINSYGISLTTLEEVFMKVGADHGVDETEQIKSDDADSVGNEMDGSRREEHIQVLNGLTSNGDLDRHSSYSKLDIMENKYMTGFQLSMNQLRAMFMKKVLSTLRSWILLLIQIIIPVAFLIIAIIVVRSWQQSKDLPPLKIELDSYDDPITVVKGDITGKLVEKYIKIVESKQHKIDHITSDFNEYILKKSMDILPTVRQRYIVGATFVNSSYVIGHFNNEPYHSLPLTLNLIHNTFLQRFLNQSYEINVVNKPLPYKTSTKLKLLEQGNNIGFQLAFNIGFSMAFVSSFYILFYVRERVSKAKHLQFVSGVKVLTFWSSAYLWDLASFILTSLCIIITLACFQEKGFAKADELGRTFTLLVCFGYSMLPMTYLASFCFDIPSTGYTRMTLINIFTGVAAFLVVEVLGSPGLDLENIADGLNWLFLCVPHYSLSTGIRSMYNEFAKHEICAEMCSYDSDCWDILCSRNFTFCCEKEPHYFKWEKPGIARNIVFSLGIGTILIATLLFIEWRIPEKIMYSLQGSYKLPPPPADEKIDDDVAAEKTKIRNVKENEMSTYNLAMKDVTKYYKNKFLAVNQLCIGVKKYECFGLLGVNGAGKTSTFKMLTGDEKISLGDAWVNGLSLKSNMKEVHQMIGYCPQFDALIDDLTGRETLHMFCLLRGISRDESRYVAVKLAAELDFTEHIDKQVKAYSGGNKRKLSTAVALIADPSVIYLDEPTTGMDPATKRHLWNVVCRVRDSGRCVVLTSHSMEECEALCTRIAIMVNGTFRCLGSVQHLKNKFSDGYTLTVKVKKSTTSAADGTTDLEVEAIKQFVMEKFTGAVLREEHQELLTFYIQNKELPWSKMFGIMESAKKTLNIEDYSLGQSSLEQVFLRFTKYQRAE